LEGRDPDVPFLDVLGLKEEGVIGRGGELETAWKVLQLHCLHCEPLGDSNLPGPIIRGGLEDVQVGGLQDTVLQSPIVFHSILDVEVAHNLVSAQILQRHKQPLFGVDIRDLHLELGPELALCRSLLGEKGIFLFRLLILLLKVS